MSKTAARRVARLLALTTWFAFVWFVPAAWLRGDAAARVSSAEQALEEVRDDLERQERVLATVNPDAVVQDAELRLAELLPPTPPEVMAAGRMLVEQGQPDGDDGDGGTVVALFGSELTRCSATGDPLPVAVGAEGQSFGSVQPDPVSGSPLMLSSSLNVIYESESEDWMPLLNCALDHNAEPHIALESVRVTASEENGSDVEARYIYYTCSSECEAYERWIDRSDGDDG